MFSTNEIFKLPWQFDERTTEWRAVELSLNLPWYLIEVEYVEERLLRTFFISSLRDVAPFIEEPSTGMKGVSMNLVLPPAISMTANWLFVPIQMIGREYPKSDGSKPQLVLTGMDGVHYGDSPFDPVKKNVGPLVTLMKFT